jgi:hypothetical protein
MSLEESVQDKLIDLNTKEEAFFIIIGKGYLSRKGQIALFAQVD